MKKLSILLVLTLVLFHACSVNKNLGSRSFEIYVLTQGQPWDPAVEVEITNNYVNCSITKQELIDTTVKESIESEKKFTISDEQLNNLIKYVDLLKLFELKDEYVNHDDTAEFDTYIRIAKDNIHKKIHVGPSASVVKVNSLINYLNVNILPKEIKLLINEIK